MKFKYVLFFLVLAACGSKKKTPNFPEFESKVFEYNNQELPYRILLPEDYDNTIAYPLIIVLHGAGERGNDNLAQMAYGPELFLKKDIRVNFPAIVVFPQCPKNGYWSNVKKERNLRDIKFTFYPDGEPTPAMTLLKKLHVDLQSTYTINKNKMYIGGLSMGGMGTFEMVRRSPNTFAAAFAICGGAHPETASEMLNTKWWVFHGDSDGVVNYKHSETIVKALKEAGAKVKFTTYKDVNHNSWENAFKEPNLIPWLFSNTLE